MVTFTHLPRTWFWLSRGYVHFTRLRCAFTQLITRLRIRVTPFRLQFFCTRLFSPNTCWFVRGSLHAALVAHVLFAALRIVRFRTFTWHCRHGCYAGFVLVRCGCRTVHSTVYYYTVLVLRFVVRYTTFPAHRVPHTTPVFHHTTTTPPTPPHFPVHTHLPPPPRPRFPRYTHHYTVVWLRCRLLFARLWILALFCCGSGCRDVVLPAITAVVLCFCARSGSSWLRTHAASTVPTFCYALCRFVRLYSGWIRFTLILRCCIAYLFCCPLRSRLPYGFHTTLPHVRCLHTRHRFVILPRFCISCH